MSKFKVSANNEKRAQVALWLTLVSLKLSQACANEVLGNYTLASNIKRLIAQIRDTSKNRVQSILAIGGADLQKQLETISALFDPVAGLQTIFVDLAMVAPDKIDCVVEQILAIIAQNLDV